MNHDKRSMTILYVISLALMLIGPAVTVSALGWKAFIGISLLMWANNITMELRTRTGL